MLDPHPDYWAALLWGRLMGPVVLDPGAASEGGLYLYSQCSPNRLGGVTVLAINPGTAAKELNAGLPGERYVLAARELQSDSVQINGRELQAGPDGALPSIQGNVVRRGKPQAATGEQHVP